MCASTYEGMYIAAVAIENAGIIVTKKRLIIR